MEIQNVTHNDRFGIFVQDFDDDGRPTLETHVCAACGREVHQIDFVDGEAVCFSVPLKGWCAPHAVRHGDEVVYAIWHAGTDTSRLVRELGRWSYRFASGRSCYQGDLPEEVKQAARRVAVAELFDRRPNSSPVAVRWDEDEQGWFTYPHPTDPGGSGVRVADDARICS